MWDLAHSSGAVELQLDAHRRRLRGRLRLQIPQRRAGRARTCLCGGAAPQGLDQPLTGWFAHAAPFAFADDFVRADGIRAMLCSTPQMLSMVALDAALDAFDGIEMRDVQQKGRALGDLMIALADERLARFGVGIASLRDGARRGNHVSLTHPEGYRIMQALIARGVIGDFRAPDVMRFGFGPLYVRYADVFDAVAVLEDILKSGTWRDVPLPKTGTVT